jgi:hypothetical protein
MINPNNLLSHCDFKPFDFSMIFSVACLLKKINGISDGKYCLVNREFKIGETITLLLTDDNLHVISAQNLELRTDKTINKHGLYIAKLNFEVKLTSVVLNKSYGDFCFSIFEEQYQWLSHFFNWTHDYLAKRIAFGQELTKHELISHALAEVLENKILLRIHLDKCSQCFNELYLKNISQLMLISLKTLANCTGGRSFTSGHIIEFYYIAQLLNNFLCP